MQGETLMSDGIEALNKTGNLRAPAANSTASSVLKGILRSYPSEKENVR
jgi:hypothetical protein